MRNHTHIFDATPEQAAEFVRLRDAASAACQAEWEFTRDYMKVHEAQVGTLGYRDFSLAEDGKHFVAKTTK